jgi:hypothetical protein
MLFGDALRQFSASRQISFLLFLFSLGLVSGVSHRMDIPQSCSELVRLCYSVLKGLNHRLLGSGILWNLEGFRVFWIFIF